MFDWFRKYIEPWANRTEAKNKKNKSKTKTKARKEITKDLKEYEQNKQRSKDY